MATVKKRTDENGRVRWVLRAEVGVNGERKQMVREYLTEKEATTELLRIGHEKNEGTYIHPDKTLTVEKLAERWAASKATRIKQSTIQHYDDALKPLIARHGNLPVVNLTDRHLIKLRDDMRSGELRRIGKPGKPLSPRSVNAMLGAVYGLLDYGKKLRLVSQNVADKALVSRVRDDETEVNEKRSGWGDAELQKFRVLVAGNWLEASWCLTAQGLRRGEVLGLKWSDIDWEAATITIRRNRTYVAGKVIIDTPKSKAGRRTVTMGASVMEALQCQRARQTVNPGDWVSVDAAGEPIHPEWYSDELGRLIKGTGLPPVVLHGVRHAVATTMHSKNVPLTTIADRLGQDRQSLAVTLGYIHPQNADDDLARAALGD